MQVALLATALDLHSAALVGWHQSADTCELSSANSSAVVIGFGKTSRGEFGGDEQLNSLRFAYLKEFSNSDCQRRYNVFFRRTKPKITRDMICAGNEEADACSGDSGSPLLWLNTDLRWMVGGVVSFGSSTCGSKAPGVYARVETGLDWILSEIS